MKLAIRYRCSLARFASCSRGTGKPRTEKCRFCGSLLVTESGLYGVFVWRGDGRYPLENAVKTFLSKAAADRLADGHEAENYVTRWILHEISGGSK